MKTLNAIYNTEYRKINKLLLTGGMLAGILTGWLIGNMNAHASSKPTSNDFTGNSKNFILSSTTEKGEQLPTVILNEFSIIAKQSIN